MLEHVNGIALSLSGADENKSKQSEGVLMDSHKHAVGLLNGNSPYNVSLPESFRDKLNESSSQCYIHIKPHHLLKKKLKRWQSFAKLYVDKLCFFLFVVFFFSSTVRCFKLVLCGGKIYQLCMSETLTKNTNYVKCSIDSLPLQKMKTFLIHHHIHHHLEIVCIVLHTARTRSL